MHGPNVEPSHELALAAITSGVRELENEVDGIEATDAESTVEWIDQLIYRLEKCRASAEMQGDER